MFKVYLLQSTRSHMTYVGHTGLGVDQRLHLHNTNTGCKYTMGKGPWEVVCYISGFDSRKLAIKFEKLVKKKSSPKKYPNESKIHHKTRTMSQLVSKSKPSLGLVLNISSGYEI